MFEIFLAANAKETGIQVDLLFTEAGHENRQPLCGKVEILKCEDPEAEMVNRNLECEQAGELQTFAFIARHDSDVPLSDTQPTNVLFGGCPFGRDKHGHCQGRDAAKTFNGKHPKSEFRQQSAECARRPELYVAVIPESGEVRVKLTRYREDYILQVPVVRCRQEESSSGFEQMRDRSDKAPGIIHVLNDL